MVDFRLRQSRAAGIGKRVYEFHKTAGQWTRSLLWSTAGTGGALHSASIEDGQDGDLRPAGQDRNQGVLPAQPSTGRALFASRERACRTTGGYVGHPAQGLGAGLSDALQADLQSSFAVVGGRGLERGRQRQMGAAAGHCRSGGVASGEDAGLYAIPRNDRAPGRFSRHPYSDGRAWCCTARPK